MELPTSVHRLPPSSLNTLPPEDKWVRLLTSAGGNLRDAFSSAWYWLDDLIVGSVKTIGRRVNACTCAKDFMQIGPCSTRD